MARDPRETDIGGFRRNFPTTIWADLLSGRTRGTPEIEKLAHAYWKPVYAFIRTKWSKSNEDAKDLTQDFFVWILESGFLQRVEPGRGRFRAFLKVSLEHYLLDVEKEKRALKRGGNRTFLSLEAETADLPRIEIPDPSARSAEEALDATWRAAVMERGLRLLEQSLEEKGKAIYYKVFREFFLAESDTIDYKTLAARYGISAGDVSTYLVHAKKRFREILQKIVEETVESPDDLKQELRWLLGEDPA